MPEMNLPLPKDKGRTSRVYVGDAKRFADWATGKSVAFNPAALAALDQWSTGPTFRFRKDAIGRDGRTSQRPRVQSTGQLYFKL